MISLFVSFFWRVWGASSHHFYPQKKATKTTCHLWFCWFIIFLKNWHNILCLYNKSITIYCVPIFKIRINQQSHLFDDKKPFVAWLNLALFFPMVELFAGCSSFCHCVCTSNTRQVRVRINSFVPRDSLSKLFLFIT